MRTRSFFFPEGGIVPGHRPVQLQMAGLVTEAFEHGGIVVAEAKTGTGKSLAYCIPAVGELLAAYGSGAPQVEGTSHASGVRLIVGMTDRKGNPVFARPRVIVSTAKKSLQHQIVGKDLPKVTSVMGELPYALLKGKQNYLCQVRHSKFVDPSNLSKQREYEAAHVDAYEAWVEHTATGDLSELPGYPFLQHVHVTECIKDACPAREGCHYLARKSEFQRAAIGLVNHAFLSYEILLGRGKLFGPYDLLVIDEAQQLISAVREAFATTLTAKFPARLKRAVTQLLSEDALGPVEGAFRDLFTTLDLYPEGEINPSRRLYEEVVHAIDALAAVRAQVNERIQPYLRVDADDVEDVFAVDYEKLRGLSVDEAGAFANAAHGVELINRATASLRRAIGVNPDEALIQELVREAKISESAAAAYLERQSTVEYACHLRMVRSTYGQWSELRTDPVDVGPMLAPFLKAMKGVVITSATLANNGDFEYMLRQFGLQAEDVRHAVALPHVFNYERQSTIYVADHLPPPDFYKGTVTKEEYYDRIADETHALLQASGGGAFVLTPSWGDLYEIRNRLRRHPDPQYALIEQSHNVQADVDRFRGGMHNVLLATKSAWEGVDVPGMALRLVIITKLPFPPESDVIIKRQKQRLVDYYLDQGKNEKGASMIAFTKICVSAVGIELAQALGRGIRSEKDLAVLAVLDARMGFRKPARREAYADLLQRVFPKAAINNHDAVLEILKIYRQVAERRAAK